MKHLILLGITAVLASILGCARPTYVPAVRSERIIDTLVRTEPDSALLSALFECDSVGLVRLREIELYKGLNAAQEFTFADNQLRVQTRWRTQYIDRLREVRDTITVVETRVDTKIVKRIPAFFWICFGLCVFGVVYIVYRVFRR